MELGIPYEWWDTPSAEVTKMQRKVSLCSVNYYYTDDYDTINTTPEECLFYMVFFIAVRGWI